MIKKFSVVTLTTVCLALVFGAVVLPRKSSSYAMVSIDINPSIDIKITGANLVEEIIPLNEEALAIIDDSMIGENVFDVMEEIIANAKIEQYLNDENNNILISSTELENSIVEALGIEMNQYLAEELEVPENIRLLYLESDDATAAESEQTGISLGRLELAKVTEDDDALEENITEFVSGEEADLMLAENVLIEDDCAVSSLAVFVSKLNTIAKADDEDGAIATFLEQFDLEGNYLGAEPDYVELLKEAKLLWKPFLHQYNVIWAHSNGDSSEDPELQAVLGGYVEKLNAIRDAMAAGDDHDEVAQWLATYEERLSNGSLVQIKNEARDLYNKYKKEYKYLFEAEAAEVEEDDQEELKDAIADLAEKLEDLQDHFAVGTPAYEAIAAWLEYDLDDETLDLKAVKDEGQDLWKEYRATGQVQASDDDEDEAQEAEEHDNEKKTNPAKADRHDDDEEEADD